MVSSKQALAKYGQPELEKFMVVWDIPSHLEVGVIPKKLYCNKDIIKPFEQAILNLIARNKVSELKTFDGFFIIRKKRRFNSMSLHSWRIAIDVNAAWNSLS